MDIFQRTHFYLTQHIHKFWVERMCIIVQRFGQFFRKIKIRMLNLFFVKNFFLKTLEAKLQAPKQTMGTFFLQTGLGLLFLTYHTYLYGEIIRGFCAESFEDFFAKIELRSVLGEQYDQQTKIQPNREMCQVSSKTKIP